LGQDKPEGFVPAWYGNEVAGVQEPDMLRIRDVAGELHRKTVRRSFQVATHIPGTGKDELHVPAFGKDPGYGLDQEVRPLLVGEAPDKEDKGRERVDAVVHLHLARV